MSKIKLCSLNPDLYLSILFLYNLTRPKLPKALLKGFLHFVTLPYHLLTLHLSEEKLQQENNMLCRHQNKMS